MIAKINAVGTATLAIAIAQCAAQAQTTISTESSTPLVTSTAGNITIAEDGELDVTTGTAITVNSNNNVTIEERDDDDGNDDEEAGVVISSGGQDNVAGILVDGTVNATIANGGNLSVIEDFVPEDDDRNGVADGPIASASNRYGIRISGSGTTSVGIENTGAIYVEGLSSAGIAIDMPYNGAIDLEGSITVIGDGSVGLRTQSVSGDVNIRTVISSVGDGASAARFEGDIGGTLTLQNSIAKATSFTNDDGDSVSLSRNDIRTNTAAVSVLGDVAGGILVATRSINDDDIDDEDGDGIDDDDDDDDDNDGVDDDDEGIGAISSGGDGPGLQIGGTDAITIGTVSRKIGGTDGGYSLVIDGSISGNSVYTRTNAYGVRIGTATGGTTTLTGGIEVTGSVSATTVDSEAVALLIEDSGSVSRLYNSGTINASISSPGDGATAQAIRDDSGTLTSIVNTGFINTTTSSDDTTQAINVSANTSGVTISQFMNDDDLETRADNEEDLNENNGPDDEYIEDDTVYTSITGDIVTGSGNDSLLVSKGTVTGDTFLNAGNDSVALSDEAQYDGDIDFGTGTGTLSLSGEAYFTGEVESRDQQVSISISDDAQFFGTIARGSQTDVTINGGRFGADDVTTTTFRSLTVKSGGAYDVYIDGEEGTSSRAIVDTATFEAGSKVTATITSLQNVEGTYNILTAGSLTGTATFDDTISALPFIYQGTLSNTGNDVFLSIRRKTTDELGLRRAASQGFNAIIDAIIEYEDDDEDLAQAILDIEDGARLQEEIDQLLPDHAGGVFDTLTRGSRLATRHITDNSSIFGRDVSDVAVWIEPIYWNSEKKQRQTVGYKNSGQGITLGYDAVSGIGRLGFSYSYLSGELDNNGGSQELGIDQHELGAFWRVDSGNFYGFAKVSGAYASLNSTRTYEGTIDDTDVVRTTDADWKGWLVSGYAGASYAFDIGSRFTLKPATMLEYHWLKEDGYEEDGGGNAIDLIVEGRTSSALSLTNSLTASYRFGRRTGNGIPLTMELEAGQRGVVKSSLGDTTAAFTDLDSFTVTADKLRNSNLVEARILGGGFDFTWKLSGRAEQYDGKINYAARASFSVAF